MEAFKGAVGVWVIINLIWAVSCIFTIIRYILTPKEEKKRFEPSDFYMLLSAAMAILWAAIIVVILGVQVSKLIF